MKCFLTLITVLLACHSVLMAQQPEQYSMYMLNKFKYNPAYAGLDNSLSFTGVIRKQWVGIDGSPASQHFNVHMPLYILNGGIGVSVENDKIGVQRNTWASLSYAFHKSISKTSYLSFGVSGGLVQKAIDGTKLRSPDGNYGPDPPIFDHKDELLPSGIQSAIAPSFGAGVYFISESLEIGLSANNLLESAFNYQVDRTSTIHLKRSFFLNLAYNLNIGNSFSMYPSVLVKSDISQTQADFSALIKYNDNIFGGASFRGYNTNSIDAIVFIAGLKLSENLTLAYSFDMTLSSLNLASSGSHELMLNYNLNKVIGAGVPQKIIYNPRFL